MKALLIFLLVALSSSTFAAAETPPSGTVPAPAVFSLEDLGFRTFDTQRDAADAILRSAEAETGTLGETSTSMGVTILRWFTGGNSLMGDVVSRRQVNE